MSASKQSALDDSKDIQVIDENGEVVSWNDFGDDMWESDGLDDVQPSFPVIKIVQGTSTMEGASKNGGNFWHSDSETFDTTLDVVALVARQTRAMFAEGINDPQCMSADAVTPLPNQPLWEGKTQPSCAECPFSQWGEDNVPPPCKNSYVVLVDRAIDATGLRGEGDLAQLRISGKSIKPFLDFVARKCKPRKLPLYAYRLALRTEEISRDGKKWHELKIAGELMTPADAKPYSDLLKAQREDFERTLRDGERVEWGEAVQDDWETA